MAISSRSANRNRPFLRRLAVKAVGLALWLAAGLPAVAGEKPADDPAHAERMTRGLELFKSTVRAVLEKKCVRCHGGKSTEAGFDLTDRGGLLKGGESGPAVIPGRGRQSLLSQLITHAKEPHMPEGGAKLPAETAAAVARWIDDGAPYDKPLIDKKTSDRAAWTAKVVSPAARQFWSFRPLTRAEPPAVKNPAWCRTSLDRFVLAKLEAAGLTPNPPADRRRLIRRASFDLTGLPPTPEAVAAFVNDPAPDAYERLIDRLLASPHYGERWARHWLDLARFGESHGFEHDYDRPTAFPYRDFVIAALNRDLPYDTFVRWQLAGDEFEPANTLALAATGFLAAGVHSTQITIKEVAKHRYDEMDDCLATVGTAMLGLTFGCARCHDHKFDPIPQRDYYQMLATFTTTVRTEVEFDVAPEKYRRDKERFDREHEPLVKALQAYESGKLPARLAEWERQRTGKAPLGWLTLDPKPASAGGATFTRLDDGSVLVGGANPTHDEFTFTATGPFTGITAVRLEALSHPSLAHGGPGRAANGNFALTDFRVTAAPVGGKPVEVRLRNPRATFEQAGLPVAAAIDDNPTSGWAVDPQFGKDHAAVFDTDGPVGFPGGTVLTFTLKFNNNVSHSIGRPRLAVWVSPTTPDVRGTGVPAAVSAALAAGPANRTPEQTTALLTWYRRLDPEWVALSKAVQDHLSRAPKPDKLKAMISSEGLPAVRLHTQGADFLDATHFLRRGDPEQKEGVASAGFLQVLNTADDPAARWTETPPKGWRTSYRRRSFANWITDTDRGAGALLARVIVNRLWQHHLGRGIVATPSDFGTRGERPSHPELLDYLAAELIRGGWHLKPIHRAILTSAAYQQTADRDEAKVATDPENKLVWRHPVRRLEGEGIRDAMLTVGGVLDARPFGPGTLDEGSRRRSVYFTVKRSQQIPMLQVFDWPDALQGIGERPNTTIAPQALLLLNNPHVRQWAKGFAARVAPTPATAAETAIRAAYETALGRPPRPAELADDLEFVRAQTEVYKANGSPDARAAALADFCQAMFCLNEFVFVE